MTDDDELRRVRASVAWDNLETALRDGSSHQVDLAYVEDLIRAAMRCQFQMKTGVPVFRGRIMPPDRQFDPNPLPLTEMGPPPPDKALAGRLNRKGEPIFYGALDPETALAELRPWVGARVSIAKFQMRTSGQVVDLTGEGTSGVQNDDLGWASFMITRPIHQEDPGAYLVTQLLARKLADRGISGILYDSALTPHGWNLALFNEASLDGRVAVLREVIEVQHDSSRLAAEEGSFDYPEPPYPRSWIEV